MTTSSKTAQQDPMRGRTSLRTTSMTAATTRDAASSVPSTTRVVYAPSLAEHIAAKRDRAAARTGRRS